MLHAVENGDDFARHMSTRSPAPVHRTRVPAAAGKLCSRNPIVDHKASLFVPWI